MLIGCESDSKKNEPDYEQWGWIYLALTMDQDVFAHCKAAQDAALGCITATGNVALQPSYIGALAVAYQITIAAPYGSSEICTPLVKSPYYPDPTQKPGSSKYKTYTSSAKICFFSCEKEYWDAINTAGNCTAAGFPGVIIDPLNTAYSDCMNRCLVRGTLLPF